MNEILLRVVAIIDTRSSIAERIKFFNRFDSFPFREKIIEFVASNSTSLMYILKITEAELLTLRLSVGYNISLISYGEYDED